MKLTDEMRKKFEEMKKLEHDIKLRLDEFKATNGIDDGVPNKDAFQQERLDAMKADIMTKMDELKALVPVKRKIVFGGDGNLEDNEDRASFGKYLLMCKYKSPEVLPDFVNFEKTVMTEGTPAQGGYLVPTYYSNMILGFLADAATIIPKCQAFPQKSLTQLIPKWLTNIVVRSVSEVSRKERTKPTFTQKTSTLQVTYALTSLSDVLLQDEESNLVNQLQQKVGEAMAVFDENLILVGRVAGGDTFNGIVNTAGINNVPQAGVSLGYSDIKNIWNNPNVLEKNRPNSEWYFNRTILGLIMEIRDNQGRPLWNLQSLNGDIPSAILGSRWNISSKILSTYGGGGNTSYIIYGNYKNVILGSKIGAGSGIIVTISQSATLTDGAGAVEESMFELNETAYRWVKRGSVVVANPEAFSVGTGIK